LNVVSLPCRECKWACTEGNINNQLGIYPVI
jgi:hypothetical protein